MRTLGRLQASGFIILAIGAGVWALVAGARDFVVLGDYEAASLVVGDLSLPVWSEDSTRFYADRAGNVDFTEEHRAALTAVDDSCRFIAEDDILAWSYENGWAQPGEEP